MKCPYVPDLDCPQIDTALMGHGVPCYDCEFYNHGIRPTGGCLRNAVAIVLIIILLL